MKPKETDLETLMNQFAPSLLRYAERLVRNPHAAQDVVQNAFIRFAQLEQEKRPAETATRSWLYRVTHNQAVDLIRKEQRQKALHETHAELEEGRGDRSLLHRKQRVLDSVHLLDEKEKAVLLLRLEEGLSYREISDITGFKEGHVGYLLHQAVQTLSVTLKEEVAS
jgi:RNA polymerase sigma-70 factor (ECF subfamily)